MDAPFPQGVKEVVRTIVNELTAASAADKLDPDIELDAAQLRLAFDAAQAERTAQAPCRRSGDQANWKPSHQKGEDGQAQKVNGGQCTRWHRWESGAGHKYWTHESERFHDQEVQHPYVEAQHTCVGMSEWFAKSCP